MSSKVNLSPSCAKGMELCASYQLHSEAIAMLPKQPTLTSSKKEPTEQHRNKGDGEAMSKEDIARMFMKGGRSEGGAGISGSSSSGKGGNPWPPWPSPMNINNAESGHRH